MSWVTVVLNILCLLVAWKAWSIDQQRRAIARSRARHPSNQPLPPYDWAVHGE